MTMNLSKQILIFGAMLLAPLASAQEPRPFDNVIELQGRMQQAVDASDYPAALATC